MLSRHFTTIYILLIGVCILSEGCLKSNPTEPATTPNPEETTTEATTTIAPILCPPIDNKASLLIDPSMTTAQSSEVYGRVAGEACADCPGVSYYPGVTNPLVTGTTKTAINNYNCVSTGLKMCICTDEEKCYSADDDNMVITLYPYCGTPTTCVVYGLLNGDAENSAFVDGQNTKVYSANDGIDENFDFRPVTSGAFPKVKSVSCGVCPPVSECLADATNP